MRRKLLIILGLAAFAFAGISGSLLSSLQREHARAVAAAQWTPVAAKLLSFHTGFQAKRRSYAVTADVSYTYTVGGREFQGSRLGYLMRDTFPTMAEALNEIERLSKSVPSQAFYNPADPSESVLSIGHPYEEEYGRRLRRLLSGAGVGAAVIAAALWLAWRMGRRPESRRRPAARTG
jgi:hypothetical protein